MSGSNSRERLPSVASSVQIRSLANRRAVEPPFELLNLALPFSNPIIHARRAAELIAAPPLPREAEWARRRSHSATSSGAPQL